jgi:hypothetical protein
MGGGVKIVVMGYETPSDSEGPLVWNLSRVEELVESWAEYLVCWTIHLAVEEKSWEEAAGDPSASIQRG